MVNNKNSKHNNNNPKNNSTTNNNPYNKHKCIKNNNITVQNIRWWIDTNIDRYYIIYIILWIDYIFGCIFWK